MESFLNELKLGQYFSVLEEEGYDEVDDLSGLTLEELTGEPISMKRGHARRILREFAKRNDDRRLETRRKKVSLLLVGEVETGKSTLAQSLMDYVCRVPYGEHRETVTADIKGESQTKRCSLTRFTNEEWDVSVIDTPGLGDTRGVSVDESHVSDLQDFLADKEFNAVCILIKRGTTRRVPVLSYVVNELKANMPKEVADHFIVVMTHAEVPIPDADMLAVIRGLDLPIANIIPVNNIAYEEMDLSGLGGDNSALVKSVVRRQETTYFENHEGLHQLLELAHSFEPYQGNNVVELKVKRDKLRERVALLSMQMDNSTKLEVQFERQKRELAMARGDFERARGAVNKNETYVVHVPYKLNGKITLRCNACSMACHINCSLSYGDNLTECSVMSGSSCNECGHSVMRHSQLGWGQRVETRVRQIRDEEKVREMSNAQDVARAVERRQAELTRDLRNLQERQEQATEEIRLLYTQLSEMAILGWNDSYEEYMRECKKDVEMDGSLSVEDKRRRMIMFQKALEQVCGLKAAIGL